MELLSNEDVSDVITWLPHGKGFTILKKNKFAAEGKLFVHMICAFYVYVYILCPPITISNFIHVFTFIILKQHSTTIPHHTLESPLLNNTIIIPNPSTQTMFNSHAHVLQQGFQVYQFYEETQALGIQ